MKIHRFYTPDIELTHTLWLHHQMLLHQWNKVLRFRPGQQVVLFDGQSKDRLYKITKINQHEANLELVTDYQRKIPKKNIYLFWSLLKKDNNDWVLQKCTELGVSHFVPLDAERSEKTGFNIERARKIIIEAAEQCGRSDIPNVREPMTVENAVKQYSGKVPLLVGEQGDAETQTDLDNIGILVGPEGGWTDSELSMFEEYHCPHLNLHDFTLRAETAAVTAVSKLLQ